MQHTRNYTKEELYLLHNELYSILNEIDRICNKHDIQYFTIGGTAIGLLYDSAILPWDDDLDIGMTRDNYNRFIRVVQSELSSDYFPSYIDTDIHTPFYYLKIKKNNTLFVEDRYKKLPMHHGIFVDIFPFDRIPNNKYIQGIHYKIVNFLKCCFMGKEIWMWNHFGKCEIDEPLQRSKMTCLSNRIINILFTKKMIFKMNVWVQTLFNKHNTTHFSNVTTRTDHISEKDINELVRYKFGNTTALAPKNLEGFLKSNFPNLHRFTEEEAKDFGNHAPYILSFNTKV